MREQGQYYNKYGLEHLLKELYSGKNDANMIQHTAIPLLFQNLFYLPQSFIVNRDVFNYEFELVREHSDSMSGRGSRSIICGNTESSSKS